MKVYTGMRLDPSQKTASPTLIVVARYDDESSAFLGMRHLTHIVRHSPDGFSWGYGGSGPADLALAILADHFHELPEQHALNEKGDWPHQLQSLRFYQDLKQDFVSTWGDAWMLQSKAIQNWVAESVADGATAPLPI
jgi:hypothetical protein